MRDADEVRDEIRKINDEQEETINRLKRISEQEEDERYALNATLNKINRFRDSYEDIDKETNAYFEKKQEMIKTIQIKQNDFEDEMKYEMSKIQEQLEEKTDALKRELTEINDNMKKEN